MSLKKVEQVKADSGFKIWDLIIYGIVIVLAAVLFIVMFTTRDNDPLTGVVISVKAESVFEYEFGGTPAVLSDTVTVEEDAKGLTVTVRPKEGDWNIIYIDKSAKTVKMKEANCKGQHCTYFSAIKNNSGYIICDPHSLKIEPMKTDYNGPIIM